MTCATVWDLVVVFVSGGVFGAVVVLSLAAWLDERWNP